MTDSSETEVLDLQVRIWEFFLQNCPPITEGTAGSCAVFTDSSFSCDPQYHRQLQTAPWSISCVLRVSLCPIAKSKHMTQVACSWCAVQSWWALQAEASTTTMKEVWPHHQLDWKWKHCDPLCDPLKNLQLMSECHTQVWVRISVIKISSAEKRKGRVNYDPIKKNNSNPQLTIYMIFLLLL